MKYETPWALALLVTAISCNGDDVAVDDIGIDGDFDGDWDGGWDTATTDYDDGEIGDWDDDIDDGFDDDGFDDEFDDGFDDEGFPDDEAGTDQTPNDCCEASPDNTPGCFYEFCEEAVCNTDPFCCDGVWDDACASQANQLCDGVCDVGSTTGIVDPTTGGVETSFGTDTFGTDTFGTDSFGTDTFGTDTFGTDTFGTDTFTNTGDPSTGGLVTGTDTGAFSSTDTGDDATSTGDDPDSNCCTPSTMGLPGCTDDACEDLICVGDPFCCNSTWDGICANSAQDDCATCQDGTSTGDSSTTGDFTSTGDFTTDTGSTTTGGDPLDAFETPQPFGDQVQETDLIGTWNLPTDGGMPGYSMSLTIGADGSFVWEELDDTCMLVREGTGVLWVAGAQLVMLFETFTGNAPWDVMTQFGWDAEPPFLIRAGYAPVLGHIAVTVTPQMRVSAPWNSRGYARTVGGTTALDVWVAETELWDVAPGEDTADIVARDRYTLDIAAGPTATLTYNRWWYEGGMQIAEPAVVTTPPYGDDMVGNLVLDGDAYTYVGARMASFEPGDNFQLGAPTACP